MKINIENMTERVCACFTTLSKPNTSKMPIPTILVMERARNRRMSTCEQAKIHIQTKPPIISTALTQSYSDQKSGVQCEPVGILQMPKFSSQVPAATQVAPLIWHRHSSVSPAAVTY